MSFLSSPLRLALVVVALIFSGYLLPVYAANDSATAENKKAPLQIEHKKGIKVVIQVNSVETIPKGISKQVLATKNLLDQYTALGMTAGKDFEIVMVFRGDGAQFLLTDAAYDAKVKETHAAGNPSRLMIEALHQGGVKLFECQVAMKLKGYEVDDILPVSRVVVSGIGALVDFEKSGYLPLTP